MEYYYLNTDGSGTYFVNLRSGETKRALSKNDIEVEGFVTDLEGDIENEIRDHFRNTNTGSNIHTTTIR